MAFWIRLILSLPLALAMLLACVQFAWPVLAKRYYQLVARLLNLIWDFTSFEPHTNDVERSARHSLGRLRLNALVMFVFAGVLLALNWSTDWMGDF